MPEYYSFFRGERLAITVPHPAGKDNAVTIRQAGSRIAATLGLNQYYVEERDGFSMQHAAERPSQHVFRVVVTPTDPGEGPIDDEYLLRGGADPAGIVIVDVAQERKELLNRLGDAVMDFAQGNGTDRIENDEDVLEALTELEEHCKKYR